jgi:patatin-like phospholipase/acyl hydrolase
MTEADDPQPEGQTEMVGADNPPAVDNLPAPEDQPAAEQQTAVYRIFSFDGGGIHALSYLPIIENLEAHLGNVSLAASGQAQMVTGTSTGAIVATAFKLGVTSTKVIEMYLQSAKIIFRKVSPWNWPYYSYHTDRLRAVLAEFYRKSLGLEFDITWEQLVEKSVYPDLELVVTLWDVRREKSAFLSTNPNRAGQATDLMNVPVADIITACCAGPYFFPPQSFKGGQSIYCDGGITGMNNPALFGLSLCAKDVQQQHQPPQSAGAGKRESSRIIDVLSFGSGETISDYRLEEIRNRNAIQIALSTIDALMSSSSRLMDRFYDAFGPSLGVRYYLRTNQVRRPDSKLDDIRGMYDSVNQFQRGLIKYELATRDEQTHHVTRETHQPEVGNVEEWDRLWRDTFKFTPRVVETHQQAAADQVKQRQDALRKLKLPAESERIPRSVAVTPSFWAMLAQLIVSVITLAFLGVSCLAFYQWYAATQAQVRAEGLAVKVLAENLSQYETIPMLISRVVIPPTTKQAFPYDDPLRNAQLRLELLRKIELYGGEQIERFRHELTVWDTAQPPSDYLRASGNLAALTFEKRYEADPLSKDSMLYAAALTNKQREAYSQAMTMLETLKRTSGPLDETLESLTAYQEFYRLYYGGLLLIESDAVELAMLDIGKPFAEEERPLVTWARTGVKPPNFDSTVDALLKILKRDLKQLDR